MYHKPQGRARFGLVYAEHCMESLAGLYHSKRFFPAYDKTQFESGQVAGDSPCGRSLHALLSRVQGSSDRYEEGCGRARKPQASIRQAQVQGRERGQPSLYGGVAIFRFKPAERRLCFRILLVSAQQLPGSSFQSREEIGGHFADAFEPLLLLVQFLFGESSEGLLFKTLNLLQHEPFEFMADFVDATTTHKTPVNTRAVFPRAFPVQCLEICSQKILSQVTVGR